MIEAGKVAGVDRKELACRRGVVVVEDGAGDTKVDKDRCIDNEDIGHDQEGSDANMELCQKGGAPLGKLEPLLDPRLRHDQVDPTKLGFGRRWISQS